MNKVFWNNQIVRISKDTDSNKSKAGKLGYVIYEERDKDDPDEYWVDVQFPYKYAEERIEKQGRFRLKHIEVQH